MDSFGFESQYFDRGFGKVLNGLEQRVVSGLQQAASVVDEYPSQPQQQQGYVEAQDTVAFWRLFDLQKRKPSLQEVKQSLQKLQLDQSNSSLRRRAELAETAFTDLADILSSAPDPTPLLSNAGSLKATINALQQEKRQVELQAHSAKIDDAEVRQLAAKMQQLEAGNSELQSQLAKEASSKADLETALSQAQQDENRSQRLQQNVQRMQSELHKLQAEHNSSQNALFELSSQREEQESARQHEAEQAATDLEEAHKKLRSLKRERDLLQHRVDAQELASPAPQPKPDGAARQLQDVQAQLASTQAQLQTAEAGHAEQVAQLQQQLQDSEEQQALMHTQLASQPKPEDLQRLQERNTMLQAMVDSPEEAEGWDAPQAERPPGTGGSMTSSTLHRILQERNRKLNTEVTRLKNQAVEQQSDIQQLQQQLHRGRAQQQEQHGLIRQLEMDLMHSSGAVSGPTDSLNSGNSLEVSNAAEGSDQEAEGGHATSSKQLQPKLLDIVTSQRDRFCARVTQLEEEVGSCRSQLQHLQSELAGKEADNVSLYEKIRYLQRYSSNRQGSSGDNLMTVVQVDDAGVAQPQVQQAHRMSCGPFSLNYGGEADAAVVSHASGVRSRSRRQACFGGDDDDDYDQEAGGKEQSEHKYRKAYEARLNPFVEFQQHETESHVNKLNLHDRALLSGSRLMLGNKAIRFFVAVYAVLLHLFVFGVVYYSAWSGSQL